MTNKKSIEAEFDKELKPLKYKVLERGLTAEDIKSFFFSQIDKILDEIVPEEKRNLADVDDVWCSGFNSCRSEILNKIKLFKE